MKKYVILFLMVSVGAIAQIGVGAKKPKNADMMFDGSRAMLDGNWAYWEGPRFAAQMPKKISFSYISGMSTDSTEQGSIMWARVKGKTENDLKKMGFRDSYSFRPGYLQPMKGNKFTLKYYKYIDWVYPLLLLVAGKTASTLEELAKAMIEVAAFPTEKKTIEVVDIKALAEQMSNRI